MDGSGILGKTEGITEDNLAVAIGEKVDTSGWNDTDECWTQTLEEGGGTLSAVGVPVRAVMSVCSEREKALGRFREKTDLKM